jgi:hypothetical protein
MIFWRWPGVVSWCLVLGIRIDGSRVVLLRMLDRRLRVSPLSVAIRPRWRRAVDAR